MNSAKACRHNKRSATWLTLFPERRSAGNGGGLFVEATEERVVVYDVLQTILDLIEADVLVIERLA